MSQEFSDKEVAATFKTLNTSHNKEESSLIGIYASWAAILLLGACFFFAAVFMLDADRRAATARLEQTSSLLVQSIESRLLGTTELLQRTSMRLMHVPGTTSRVRSSELAAMGFMHDRREVLELALIDRDYHVLRHWISPSHSTLVNNTVGSGIQSEESRKAIENVLQRDASFIAPPYTLDHSGQVFVNIYVPTPVPDQILLARVNFTLLIHEAADLIGGLEQSHFYTAKNGKLLREPVDENDTPKLTHSTPIPIFNDPSVTLVSESFKHQLFTPDNIKLWGILALAGMLALALTLLLKNQKEQHAAHRRLSAEYSLRVAMAESSLAGVRVTDLEGHILFVNETFQKLVGYSADELFGKTFPYPYWSEDISSHYADILDKPEIHHVRTLEFQVRRKDGIVFDAQLNVSPLLNEDGRIIGWIGELYDISEQKRARERMISAHERFTRVVHSMNSAICVISIVKKPHTAPHMLFHNAPYARIFGPDVAGARRLVALINKSPRISRDIYDDLTGRWFDARMQMLTWTDDTEACMIIATDITNQRETELALEEQMRRAETTQRLVTMGEMASSLAHELNQPLAAISNYAVGATCMIEAGKLSQEDTLVALGKISKQAQRAAAIIKRIRSFAATKKTDPQFTAVSPETIVTETMELALIQAAKLNAQIETTIAPNLPDMKGDSVMLEQLLLNLLKNAMEAVQPFPNHTVELNVAKNAAGDFIEFQIRDHGPGISDENKALLYDAFYSTKSEGMGMGLNICRSIVEVHQGRITITDTPGGGATFTFTIPILCESAKLL